MWLMPADSARIKAAVHLNIGANNSFGLVVSYSLLSDPPASRGVYSRKIPPKSLTSPYFNLTAFAEISTISKQVVSSWRRVPPMVDS
jgi:hypothetical protein